MPEGDTIYKLAQALAKAWRERRVEELWLRERGGAASLVGSRIREVAALGKHLLIALDPGPAAGRRIRGREWVLHLHLGMNGRLRLHPADVVASRADLALRIASDPENSLASQNWRLTGAATAELLPRSALRDHPVLRRLGPDLLAAPLASIPPVARREILARAGRRSRGSVAELLLDQQVACGIGNVYKSEVLFLNGLDPCTPSATLAPRTVVALYQSAAELLALNTAPGPRTTRPGGRGAERYWVYRRAGRPCLRCRAPVGFERVGDVARVTYWCRRCQPASASAAPGIAAAAGVCV